MKHAPLPQVERHMGRGEGALHLASSKYNKGTHMTSSLVGEESSRKTDNTTKNSMKQISCQMSSGEGSNKSKNF